MADTVYGKQPIASVAPVSDANIPGDEMAIPELTSERIELLTKMAEEHQYSTEKRSDSDEYRSESGSFPELTQERIALLERIGGLSNNEDLPTADTSASETVDLSALSVTASTVPSELVKNSSSTNSEWENFQQTDQLDGAKEGFAFSGWTAPSPSADGPDDNIQAALVASCNDEGDKSLYVRLLSTYPNSDTVRSAAIVKGQVLWDSSTPYGAPFVYDEELNALRLRSGLDDSFSMLKEGKKVTIQLPWNDEQHTTFEFSLKGSTQAIQSAFDYCLL